MTGAVLIASDEAETRDLAAHTLTSAGLHVTTCETAELAAALERARFDGLVLDVDPGQIRRIRERTALPATVLLAEQPDVKVVLEAMRLGVQDVLSKPFPTTSLKEAVSRLLDGDAIAKQDSRLEPDAPLSASTLVGSSPAMTLVRRLVEAIAVSEATVMISGETGTGKEVVAREIHRLSKRANGPFIAINCAAIPETLLESELFGHEKGAFTGAVGRKGRFALAEGGTIFLDEIGEMPLSFQPKLLRVLQEREVDPVGGSRPRRVDVRIIAATNRDLGEMVESGEFRQDLYYRLNVVPLFVPPLRERSTDLVELIEHFAQRIASDLGSPTPTLTPDAVEALRGHDWPGNVRELSHLVERMVVLNPTGIIDGAAVRNSLRSRGALRRAGSETTPIPFPTELPEGGVDLRTTLAAYEQSLIRAALERTNGNKNRAASLLGLNRTTLVEKIKRTHRGELGLSSY